MKPGEARLGARASEDENEVSDETEEEKKDQDSQHNE